MCFLRRKIETGKLNDYSSKFTDSSGPSGTTIKPLVAMAPCGGPIGDLIELFERFVNDCFVFLD